MTGRQRAGLSARPVAAADPQAKSVLTGRFRGEDPGLGVRAHLFDRPPRHRDQRFGLSNRFIVFESPFRPSASRFGRSDRSLADVRPPSIPYTLSGITPASRSSRKRLRSRPPP